MVRPRSFLRRRTRRDDLDDLAFGQAPVARGNAVEITLE
jgi:hypothetical protein